jgi:hypothetical protein
MLREKTKSKLGDVNRRLRRLIALSSNGFLDITFPSHSVSYFTILKI